MKKTFSVLACLLILLTAAAPLYAFETVAKVHVTLIIASNTGNDTNLTNDTYRDQLLQLFSYKAYKQIDDIVTELKRSKRETLELPDGFQLILTLQDLDKGRAQVQAMIRKGNNRYLDTVVSILRPGVVFLGGPSAQGGTLIIVLETGF